MADQFTVLQTSSRASDLADPFSRAERGEDAMAVRQAELVRLAIVAAGVGARFERERIPHDPVAWLLAPREMFDGESALTACLGETAFERALVLHADGAGLGLDADPRFLDQLLADETDGHAAEVDADEEMVAGGGPRHDPPFPQKSSEARAWRRRAAHRPPVGDRLFSTGFTQYASGGRVQVFVAAVVDSERTFRNRLFERYGAIAALGAKVREGFDLYDTISARLISDHVAHHLSVLAVEPGAPTAEGFAVIMEQRA